MAQTLAIQEFMGLLCSKLGRHRRTEHLLRWQIKELQSMRVMKWVPRRLPPGLAITTVLALGCAATLYSQEPVKQVVVDEKTLRALLTRVEQLETRVKQLEAERTPPGAVNSPVASA